MKTQEPVEESEDLSEVWEAEDVELVVATKDDSSAVKTEETGVILKR